MNSDKLLNMRPSSSGQQSGAGIVQIEFGSDLGPEECRRLFVVVCRALAFDELRLKPREKQFYLLLGADSLGEGSAQGWIDINAWRLRLGEWRSNEIKRMFESWRRAGWIMVDVTEDTYRLAPDQLPGWANVQGIQKSEQRVAPLNLMTEDDLHKNFAKISQGLALRSAGLSAEKSQAAAKISQRGEPTEGNVPTFNRLTSERINVERGACENFASAAPAAGLQVEKLRQGVREFVGEKDWTSREFWDCGEGWRARLFTEEYRQLEGALSYCKAALLEKGSGVTVRKTRGAMLWDEFQRLRRSATSAREGARG